MLFRACGWLRVIRPRHRPMTGMTSLVYAQPSTPRHPRRTVRTRGMLTERPFISHCSLSLGSGIPQVALDWVREAVLVV